MTDPKIPCKHREPDRWVWEAVDVGFWGTEEQWVVYEGKSTQVGISVGAFKCTKCGDVGYYTGLWRAYHEDGVSCPGSDKVPRVLPNL